MDKILEAREKRSNLIKSHLNNDLTIISIKANIIGVSKNPYYAYLIINVFLRMLKDSLNLINFEFHESDDGPFYLIQTTEEAMSVKKKCIKIEDEHLLGRLVDLDVYNIDRNITRGDFEIGFRKCLICNDYAILCMRQYKHTILEVKEKENVIVRNYLFIKVKEFIDLAITLEANLDPKFGLVTKFTNGSHTDMDYNLLMSSKDAIVDDLVEMFFLGFDNDLVDGFKKARKLGLSTEKKMYEVTNKVNTYKGLIFILGIVLVAIGYSIKNKRNELFELISVIGKDLLKELEEEIDTFGKSAYSKFGLLGARGEVHNGLENVRLAKEVLKGFSEKDLTMTLVFLIGRVEDTVLLKRSKTLDKYNYYKGLVSSINKYDLIKINNITSECIQDNISFGGSADLLIATIFIRLIEEEMGIIYE